MIKSGSSQSKRQREEINPEDCAFYGQFDKGSKGTREFFEFYPALQEKGQIIISSDNFILIPDIAPITADHLLVVPKNHFRSFASLPKSFNEEVEQIVSEAVNKMENMDDNTNIERIKEKLVEAYNKTAQEYGIARNEKFDAFLEQELKHFIDSVKQIGTRVIDVGSGSGNESMRFKEAGLGPVCVDISPAMVEECKKKGLDAHVMRS